MKSNCYASIDAHIIRCRLHHHNNLSYSVALKSGKSQQVNTPFKPSQELIIDMDTHLFLQVDKHSYEQFPKLTLIVNTMGENNERKTVGTTFANFRKEGIQTFQVSECSCKDKAFEVDISFSCKVEAKSSSNVGSKKTVQGSSKPNYLSQQVTPRESRQLQSQLGNQKSPQSKGSPIKETNLYQVRSQKVLGKFKESQVSLGEKKNTVELLKAQIAGLTSKMSEYENEIQDLKRYKKMLFEQQINSEKWLQLLKLEEEKNSMAMSHIISLEEIILSLLPQRKSGKNNSTNSFRIIEEEDQIWMMNEELQSELEKERSQNKVLEKKIHNLKRDIQDLTVKLRQSQEMIIKLETLKEPSKVKSQVSSLIESPNEIMITSRVQDNKNDREKVNFLEQQIEKLDLRYQLLKTQVNNLEEAKKKLAKEIKPKTEGRKTTNAPAKTEEVKKTERVNSKDKGSKPPPARTTKRNSIVNASGTLQSKKVIDTKIPKGDKKTKVSSEAESKTEGCESVNKSSQLELKEMKSETSKPIVNEVFYMANTFQQEV